MSETCVPKVKVELPADLVKKIQELSQKMNKTFEEVLIFFVQGD